MITEINKKDLGKTYWFTAPWGTNLLFSFKGNFTQTRKLAIAREIIEYYKEVTPNPVPEGVTEDDLIGKALQQMKERGGVYDEVEKREYDFKDREDQNHECVDLSSAQRCKGGLYRKDVRHITIG